MTFARDTGNTKQEVSELRSEVGELRSEIKDIRSNGATKQDVSDLRSEMQAMELRLTVCMGGLIAAGVALIVALDQLL